MRSLYNTLKLMAVGTLFSASAVMAAQTCSPEQLESLEESKHLFGPLSWPVCKALPNRPELTLASYFVWTDGAKPGERTYQWNTVILDSKRHKVQAVHREFIHEGKQANIRPDSIWLDTANYALNDQVRAFGVRLNTGADLGCERESRGQFLNLFVYQNHILTRVVENLPTEYSRVHEGSMCDNSVEWEKEVAKSHLQILPTKHYGFADIKLKSKGVFESKSDYRKESGKGFEKSRGHTYIFKYDGEKYSIDRSELPSYRWTDPENR